MRRLYYIVPNISSAKMIVDELLLARVDEGHLHIISSDENSLAREHLPEATFLEKSDFVPATERGVAIGGATGLVAGCIGYFLEPAAFSLGPGGFLAVTIAGALFGAWVSGMIGISMHNTHLQAFEPAIESGRLLLMIDVPTARVDEISQLVRDHHPEITTEGTEPTMPAFP
jgi:hypothetical protein